MRRVQCMGRAPAHHRALVVAVRFLNAPTARSFDITDDAFSGCSVPKKVGFQLFDRQATVVVRFAIIVARDAGDKTK